MQNFNFDSEEEKNQILSDLQILNEEGHDYYITPGADGIKLYFDDILITEGDIEVKNRLRILRKEQGI